MAASPARPWPGFTVSVNRPYRALSRKLDPNRHSHDIHHDAHSCSKISPRLVACRNRHLDDFVYPTELFERQHFDVSSRQLDPGCSVLGVQRSQRRIHECRTVYLDLTMPNGPKRFWNPVTGEFKSAAEIDVKDLSRTRFIPAYSPESLSNGSTIKMSIVSTGARCGYTVGVDFTYSESNSAIATFYIIEKYKSLKKTFYCGTPLTQRYDVEVGYVAVSLADERLIIIDFAKKSAITFLHVPTTIVALDDESFLVPAEFLKPGLDAAGDNQGARYRALLATLKSHPAAVVHPTRVG